MEWTGNAQGFAPIKKGHNKNADKKFERKVA